MACVSGIQKHRPGADRTKLQVGLEKRKGRFRTYTGPPDSPSFIDDNVLPVNMPAFTPAQKQSGRTGGRSQPDIGETLKNRSVNHHLVHPDISPGQAILHPGNIFLPPPFHFLPEQETILTITAPETKACSSKTDRRARAEQCSPRTATAASSQLIK